MKLKSIGVGIVFVWFAAGGVLHFVSPEPFVRIVPPYVPFPLAMVYISGVFELLGAIGILLPAWRSRAGVGLIILTLCVTPANAYMWMNAELFPTIRPELLGLRLILQVVLLTCIWWSTQPPTIARSKKAATD